MQYDGSFKLKLLDAFIFYHIVVIDKNSIWQLIQTKTLNYDMSIVDLMANISQWKNIIL